MNHLREEKLILHYYREEDASAHLDSCAECREEFVRLRTVLDSIAEFPVPERDADYGARLFERLRPALAVHPRATVIAFPRWPAIAAVAAMILAAFYLGRVSRPPERPVLAAIPAEVRTRILTAAVGDHFDRTQLLLAELVNDRVLEPARAEDLLGANRLYRQTAVREGDVPLSMLLDELERTLLDVAHASPAEVNEISERIRTQGILFKVRVAGSTLRSKEKSWNEKSWL